MSINIDLEHMSEAGALAVLWRTAVWANAKELMDIYSQIRPLNQKLVDRHLKKAAKAFGSGQTTPGCYHMTRAYHHKIWDGKFLAMTSEERRQVFKSICSENGLNPKNLTHIVMHPTGVVRVHRNFIQPSP